MFGGLITIPFWCYKNTPIAIIDVMLADLPRVEYTDPDKVTQKDIDRAQEKTNKITERVKKHGLGVHLSNQIKATNSKGAFADIIKKRG